MSAVYQITVFLTVNHFSIHEWIIISDSNILGKKWTATTYKVRTKQKNDSAARSAQQVLLKETIGILKWKGKKNHTVGKVPTYENRWNRQNQYP